LPFIARPSRLLRSTDMKKAAFLLAMAGFILVLGSFGQADCGASIGSILPTTVAGIFMMAGGSIGCTY
jgi:hypothetical protein